MAPEHGPHLRDHDAGVGREIEAGIGAGKEAFCDQFGRATGMDGDHRDARCSELHDCERSCGGAWIDKPCDCGELAAAGERKCRRAGFAFENGHAAFVERSHEAASGRLVRRHQKATFER